MFPGRVKIPITRVLGGARFDVIFEACVGNYHKRPETMAWLMYVLALPGNTNIMQRALWIQLRSVEMIAQLRVGAIFYLCVLVPMRWLSANTHLLEHRKWGEKHMASAIDCVCKKCQKIKERPALILQESFMMNIFSKLYRKVPELKDYLDWFRGEKINMVHGCSTKASRVCGMEIVIEELFYPKEASNRQTHEASLDLGDELAEGILVEFQDTSKVTNFYVDELGGKYSMSKTTRQEKEQGYGIRANNDPSEQGFAVFRDALSHMGNASVYKAAGEGSSRYNNDWGRGVDALVTGRKSNSVSALPFCCPSMLFFLESTHSPNQRSICSNTTRVTTTMMMMSLVCFIRCM